MQQETMYTQYTRDKYIEHDLSKQTSMRMHRQQVVAIEFTRRQEHEPFASRTFIRQIALDYKRA